VKKISKIKELREEVDTLKEKAMNKFYQRRWLNGERKKIR
jgi:hypothetical protein